MKTTIHSVSGSATHLHMVEEESIDLVVTSPPYPMIEMWDDVFSARDGRIGRALEHGDGAAAFERMHTILDTAWTELFRVLKPGGIACINIGDATRSFNGDFRLYSNHARILTHLSRLGFVTLPDILWRKPTNAPNKFMGSGMLPVGAYVTYEHEYILVVRKGNRRIFRSETEKQKRRRSAFFWEERNVWFSDVWFDIKGIAQQPGAEDVRRRSAAFPFELAYRLICMFSIKEDRILDPFLGTGTTTAAAIATGRNAVGVEIDERFHQAARTPVHAGVDFANLYNIERLDRHIMFVSKRSREEKPMKYTNVHYGFSVMTAQEKELLLNEVVSIDEVEYGVFDVVYADTPQAR